MPHQYFQTCIDECAAYHVVCLHCAISCLTEKDALTLSAYIQLDLDCANICETAVGLMARGNTQANAICELCARTCQACVAEYAKHSREHCQECARVYEKCADACRAMH